MSAKLKVGIAGLGTVGATLAARLLSEPNNGLELTAVSARDRSKDRGFSCDGLDWYDDALGLTVADNVDIVVELIGGAEGVARDLVTASIANGKHVVTANKALMATYGFELAETAEAKNVVLAYEAAVAGGIPVIKVVREALKWNRITSIKGILNGTCNFILSEMKNKGAGFDETLKIAQDLGYAEADPGFDIDGVDAAQKLAILAALGFGVRPNFDVMDIQGITAVSDKDLLYASHFNSVIRLVAICAQTDDGILQWVGPCLVPNDQALAHIEGVTNAVQIEGDMIDSVMLQGPGAGGAATASSVLSDLNDIVCGNSQQVFARRVGELGTITGNAGLPACPWYLRLALVDRTGSMAKVTSILAEHGVSIEEVVQKGPDNGDSVRPVIFITHTVGSDNIYQALDALKTSDVISDEVSIMPVLATRPARP
ncbi:MAG: homoserine dehydrogenase [Parvibaculales bacterium]